MTKNLTALLVVPLLCAAAFAQAPDRGKIANIEEIFRLTKVDQLQQQMFAQIKNMVSSQFDKMEISSSKDQQEVREFQDHMFSMILERLSWDKMKPRYVQLYDQTYTAPEIAGILDFYKSPAGRAMLEKMPVLMSKSMSIAQEQMADLMPEIQRTVEEFAARHKREQSAPGKKDK